MKQNIALSILSTKKTPVETLKEYKESIDRLKLKNKDETFEHIVHIDVMDGKFVPNIGVSLEYVKTAKNMGFYVDTHLMVENPIGDKYIEKILEYGTDEVTIHFEIKNFESVLKFLNDRKKYLKEKFDRDLTIGVAINPETQVEEVLKFESLFSKFLVMSVVPGMGGQNYILDTNNKLKLAKNLLKSHIIQVDGGINFETINYALNMDVDSVVIGSYITLSEDIYSRLLSLEVKKEIEMLPKDSNIEFDTKLLQIVPGGYGQNDVLIGITTPNIRKIAGNWYKTLTLESLSEYISSNYHEYRKFACIVMSNLMKYLVANESKNKLSINKEDLIKFFDQNLKYVNNWDLTDEVAPNVLGKYLITKEEKEQEIVLEKYLNSSNYWIQRIGVVACLEFARLGYREIPIKVCRKMLYHENNLINKAVGWVLREVYKKYPIEIFDFLYESNNTKKIPRYTLSYAMEKMSKEEKEKINCK